MKNLDPALQNTLTAESFSLVWCWLIQRVDGVILGFTSFDLPLLIDGVSYRPETGFNPSASDNQEGVDSSNSQNLQGILSSEQISDEDLAAGKYDYADITCFLVNPTDLPPNLTLDPAKHIINYSGKVGKISRTDRSFSLEARTIDYELEATLGQLTSKFCRNNFGDFRCGVDLTPHTYIVTITAVTNQFTVAIDGNYEDGIFDRGLFTVGDVSRDIATFASNEIVLFKPFPTTLQAGEQATVIRGCAKTLLACAVFGGILGNDSEPHVPLPDDALNPPVSN